MARSTGGAVPIPDRLFVPAPQFIQHQPCVALNVVQLSAVRRIHLPRLEFGDERDGPLDGALLSEIASKINGGAHKSKVRGQWGSPWWT